MESDIAPFRGFGPDLVAFYEGLAEDNTRDYFHAHRDVYDAQVREPMERLLADVADEFGDDAKVFRPNRDVRFSRDKSPYKLACGAVVGNGRPTAPIWYVQVSSQGLRAASGYYRMSRDQVMRYLAAVDDDTTGPALERLVAAARAEGATIGGSELKTSPRGYPNDHPRVELLRHKGVTIGRSWKPYKWLQTREALVRTTALWHEAAAINEWLVAHVGAPRPTDHARR